MASRSYLETSPRRLVAVCGLPNYSTLRFRHLVASFLFMEEGLLMISVIIIIINTSKVAPPRNAGNWWGRAWGGQYAPLNTVIKVQASFSEGRSEVVSDRLFSSLRITV